MNDLQEVFEALEMIKKDSMTLKRVKEKISGIVVLLQQDAQLNIDKALRELEEISASEIPAYDRTKLWDIVSMLESLTASTRP